MTQEDNRSFAQKWQEYWGRKRVMEPIPFDETSILTQSDTFRVGEHGHYLLLPAMTAAIITSPSGQKMVFVEGGYKDLQDGAYSIQYVDLRDRTFNFPAITASTLDGLKVSLTVSISYKVNDPVEIVNVATPLQTLFSVCEAAIKKFIITHHHHEVIGEPGNEQVIADHEIIKIIKEQIAMNQACRSFWVMDIIIKERYGDPELSTLKHEYLVQEKKSITQLQNVVQQQGIAMQQKELERTKAEIDSMVQEMQALCEANKSEILKHARLLDIQLEAMRKQPDMQQAQIMSMIDLKRQSLDTLLRLYTISGFPRDINDINLMEKIIGSLSEPQIITPEIPSERSKSVNELSSTIINLITPRKKE
ncbi:MAG: SPFH domain-containing protein [Chloroflexota bacterium]